MKKSVFIILIVLFAAIHLKAQSSIAPSVFNASGGSNVVDGATYEWSIGEMAIVATFSTSTIVLTQGILQPADIVTGTQQQPEEHKYISVYPNPATDYLQLKSDLRDPADVYYAIYDMSGRLVSEHSIRLAGGSAVQRLDLINLPLGTYFMNVNITEGQRLYHQTYSFQKIN